MTRRLDALIRALPTLLLLGVLVLGGWLAARWFWYFATPSETPAPQARPSVLLSAAAQTVADAHLFGAAPGGAGGEVISNLNIKLKGVFASSSDAPAYAILNTGSKDESARAGGEIVPGVVLESVHPGHVMLRRNGALERINLEQHIVAAAGAAPPRPVTRPPSPPSPVQAPSPARFQRPEPYAPVGDAPAPPPPPPPSGAQPQPAAPAGPGGVPQVQSSAQGLVIQTVPTGSALERFGLQPGDVIRSVNGERVTSEADIARIMRERGLQGQYTAEVVRGGMTIPLAVGAAR